MHLFTDISYYEVEEYCLAITNQEASSVGRSGQLDSTKFIAAGPQSFRAFGLHNFNTVNFLSSGTSRFNFYLMDIYIFLNQFCSNLNLFLTIHSVFLRNHHI